MPRPKQFEPEAALDRAMRLFWRRGYEATSIQDLVDELKINRFSLYDTFGDKHGLFLAALDRYRTSIVRERLADLEARASGLARIRAYFGDVLAGVEGREGWQGCLMTNAAVEVCPRDAAASKRIKAHLETLDEFFARAIEDARKAGEVPASVDVRGAARFLTATSQGIGVLVKTRPARSAVEGIIRRALGAIGA